jgi:O-antigen ligase
MGLIYFTGVKNPYFARMWEFWQRQPAGSLRANLGDYIEYMGFGPRFLYWETAYRIFEQYPLTGVGLGNYAFYFSENIPERSLATMPEVLRLLVPEVDRNNLITTKHFYLRILAETGLIGAATFLAFLTAICGCALYLWPSRHVEFRFWGVAGLLGLIAFLMVAFSFDSFAIPNMWVVFGFITAAARLYHHLPVSLRKGEGDSLPV